MSDAGKRLPARRTQLGIGVGTLLLGLALAVGAAQIRAEAGYSGVGPNFLPWLVAAALALCGVGLVWEALHGGFANMEEPSGAARGDWGGFAWVTAALLANAALITSIGFILSCTLCFVLAVRGFKHAEGAADWRPAGWLRDVAIGFAIAAPVYWTFTKLLGINLPGLTASGWL